MLIRSLLLFLALGFLFFMLVLALEYWLWLNSTGRMLLLAVFVSAEAFLFFRYILLPLCYLFRLRKGISHREASVLIGRHFPEVGDKLLNLLELAGDKARTELLLASIAQRSEKLNPIPFNRAIDLRDSLRYIRYLAIPLVFVALIWLTGNLNSFFSSYQRVVNYDLAYEPPAPFQFKLLNGEFDVLEDSEFTVELVTEGKIKPEAVFIVIDGKELLMQQQNGMHYFAFKPPLQNTDFLFRANGIESRPYRLNALKAPAIRNFSLELTYPPYTKKAGETLKSTGNATFPEGTRVKWQIEGEHAGSIRLITEDTLLPFERSGDETFTLSKSVYSDLSYQITTSNEHVEDYEKLDYRFRVIRDAYPEIKVRQLTDSLNPKAVYFTGEASDDYELSRLALQYYPDGAEDEVQRLELGRPNKNFERFYYTFPSGLNLQAGQQYSFYFAATDNDAIRGGKTAVSQVFQIHVLDDNQLKNRELEMQQSLIRDMDRSLDNFREQKKTLGEINREQKEKSSLNFNDHNEIRDFLKRQERQEEMMKKFSKEMSRSLAEEPKEDKLNSLLRERLERQELEARKNEKLLEELRRIADKIDKEELSKRLEELGKQQNNSERNLEQLLELTKRYYVTEKAAQLARDLEKQAKRQDILSALKIGEDFSAKEQEKLNEQFEKSAEELDELRKENANLKKPLALDIEKAQEDGVKEDQQQALEEINKHQGTEESSKEEDDRKRAADRAKQKQKAAAQKIRQLSEQLQQSSAAGGSGATIVEDAEMLRQILDNLVIFSLKQETLYEALEASGYEEANYSGNVRDQQELRELFEHIDDSLFALSLRRAELSEFVNEQITEVYYNIDQSLERLAEDQIYQGVSYQQYVLTASNNLADFLANLLDNMQQSMMSGSGQGQGNDMQLPDIIKSQSELGERMGEMGKKGQRGEQGEQGEGNQGREPDGEEGPGDSESGKKGSSEGEGEGGRQGSNRGSAGEEELRELYEIYKEQEYLRQQLEEQLEDMINAGDKQFTQKLLQQMEEFANDLLNQGITEQTMNRMNTIEHRLLQLKNASLRQGREEQRRSNTNRRQYQNPITTKPPVLDNYEDEIEILNRQALPLRQHFQRKVQDYFQEQ